MKLIEETIRWFFPLKCVGCKSLGQLLCDTCRKQINVVPTEKDGILSFLTYKDPLVRNLIWELKYKNNRESVVILSKIIAEHLNEMLNEYSEFTNAYFFIITPVPSHKKRSGQRFKHTNIIAEEIGKNLLFKNTIIKDLLINKSKKRQSETKSRKERLSNINGKIFIKLKRMPSSSIVLLVDDVTTTGSTQNECARILRKNGALHVIQIALCR